MCVEDIFQVSRITACFRIEVHTTAAESTCFQDYQHSFYHIVQVHRELIGIPAVLLVTTVCIDTTQEAIVGSYLQLVLEGMASQRCVVHFDVQFKVFIQAKMTE